MKRSFSVLFSISLLFLVGCSSAPEQEEADARGALRVAREAEAEVYAAQELGLAQSEFDRAFEEKSRQEERFRPLRSFGAAKEGFIHARELAEAARTAADRNRTDRADESRRQLDQAQRAIEACSDTLAGAPPGSKKGVKVDLAVFKDDILVLAEELEGIMPQISAGQFDAADSISMSISRRATALQEEIITAANKNRKK